MITANDIKAIRKAVVGAALATAGAFGLSMLDGDITQAEAMVAAGTGLLTLAGTYAVPNRGPQHRADPPA